LKSDNIIPAADKKCQIFLPKKTFCLAAGRVKPEKVPVLLLKPVAKAGVLSVK
jgi:hypothetical protein